MRSRVVALVLAPLVSLSAMAEAQETPPPKPAPAQGPSRSSTQYTMRREEAGGVDAQNARARARSGDCAGALPLFDAAIGKTVEPTLRRDRGLCHEKLSHPFPAMEDYRAYLEAAADAPDSEQIRQRLNALEAQEGVGPRAAKADSGGKSDGAYASISLGESGAGASGSASSGTTVIGPKAGEPAHSYDYYVEQEKLTDEANKSPLRYGSGFVIGPFLHMPRFFVGEGARGALSYGVGGTFRYATGRTVTLVSELGWAGTGVSGESSSLSGPLVMGGVELRLPVSRYAGDHILLRGGIGYERYVVSGTRAITDDLLGRFAVGFRHVFGPAIAFEVLFDGGPVLAIPESGDNRVNGVLGASFAFVVGF